MIRTTRTSIAAIAGRIRVPFKKLRAITLRAAFRYLRKERVWRASFIKNLSLFGAGLAATAIAVKVFPEQRATDPIVAWGKVVMAGIAWTWFLSSWFFEAKWYRDRLAHRRDMLGKSREIRTLEREIRRLSKEREEA